MELLDVLHRLSSLLCCINISNTDVTFALLSQVMGFILSIDGAKNQICVHFLNSHSRPAVRALPSKQMFEHMMKRHDVLFVYVGGESPLKVGIIYFTSRRSRVRFSIYKNA